jgi:hypothetical protein
LRTSQSGLFGEDVRVGQEAAGWAARRVS